MKIISLYQNEKKLIRKAANGDREAQRLIYEKHAPKMLSVCRQYIRDRHFAEDVMIDGFIKVFKYLDQFKFKGSFEGWVRRIMTREAISFLRKQQFVVFDQEQLETYAGKFTEEQNEEEDYIQSLIDQLPDGYKTVFLLFVVEEYRHKEIAELLGITESTSKSQLFKARKCLQEMYKEQNKNHYGTR